MKQIRQDAWSQEEDSLLAEIVLHYIENGDTQIEAFKEAAKQLQRTPAACGFRWNASIREKHEAEIARARSNKRTKQKESIKVESNDEDENLIESAIALLEKINPTVYANQQASYEHELAQLQEENKRLKKQMVFYEEAWQEMGKIWEWSKEQGQL
ncbi:MAG TPA: RsfA family transcriptional regulator [Pseudogracilibacillus sp.]|nr:RsfA family transcriptional regulator [Pseudogracilibacillus sp.]